MAHTSSQSPSIPLLLGKVIISLTTIRLAKVMGIVFGKNERPFLKLLIKYQDGIEETIDPSQVILANGEQMANYQRAEN